MGHDDSVRGGIYRLHPRQQGDGNSGSLRGCMLHRLFRWRDEAHRAAAIQEGHRRQVKHAGRDVVLSPAILWVSKIGAQRIAES